MQRAQWVQTRQSRKAFEVVGHRRLEQWKLLIKRTDECALAGFIALASGIIGIIVALTLAGFALER